MIKLTTALLTLGVGTAIATTAIAQDSWWAGCNPQASLCRQLYTDPPWQPRYDAPTYPRSMYMYAPRHSTHTHRTSTTGRY
jgi:hypothetical protein